MPSPEPHDPTDPVIVTSASRLRALVDEAAERASERVARRLFAELRAGREAEWLTVRRAEAAYGVGRSTLHRWRQQGLVEWKKVGGRLYYRAPGFG